MKLHSTLTVAVAVLLLGGFVFAQTSAGPKAPAPGVSSSKSQSKPQAKAPASKPGTSSSKSTNTNPSAAKPDAPKAAMAYRQECSKQAGFCIDVPKTWKSLGPVFDGAGFVVAEPDDSSPQDDWNEITAATIDMPGDGDGERPSTDEMINMVLGAPAGGITTETVRRRRVTVAGMPTEVLKLRLHENASDAEAYEFIALLDDGESVYSVTLGCAPDDVTRLEPVFEKVLNSWKPIPPAVQPPAK